jgi:hypothetical protein
LSLGLTSEQFTKVDFSEVDDRNYNPLFQGVFVMQIITTTDPLKPIKKVKLEGLRSTDNEFAAILLLEHSVGLGARAKLVLNNFGGLETFNPFMRGELPDALIPQFAVAWEAFAEDFSSSMSSIVMNALSNLLNDRVNITFTRNEDKVMVYIKIGYWSTDGILTLEEVKDYLVPK